jgi:hypothetical protein
MSISAPLPVEVAFPKRREDRHSRIEAGEDVGISDAGLLRLAVRLPRQRHGAAHALDDEIIAGANGIRAGLAEAGDRAENDTRVQRARKGSRARSGEAADLEFSISTSASAASSAHRCWPGCS